MTRGSPAQRCRPPSAAVYNTVRQCTALLGLASAQRGALTCGGPGMGLFDAATPLQKRKRNQRVAWPGASRKSVGSLSSGLERPARSGSSSSILLWGAPLGRSVQAPDKAQHWQDIYTRPGPLTTTSTLELPSVPTPIATEVVVAASWHPTPGTGSGPAVSAGGLNLTDHLVENYGKRFTSPLP